MRVKITSNDRMSNAGLHRSGGLGSPHSRWSLRSESGAHVNLYAITGSNDALRGDRHLEIECDLEPGLYTLSCGRGKDRIEQTIVVGEAAESRQQEIETLLSSLPRIKGVSRSQADYATNVRDDWAREFVADLEEAEALKSLTSARAILDNKDRLPTDALADQEAE